MTVAGAGIVARKVMVGMTEIGAEPVGAETGNCSECSGTELG